MVYADFDGDGREDLFVGAGSNARATLFFQTINGSFIKQNAKVFESAAASEDSDALAFDANGDGFLIFLSRVEVFMISIWEMTHCGIVYI